MTFSRDSNTIRWTFPLQVSASLGVPMNAASAELDGLETDVAPTTTMLRSHSSADHHVPAEGVFSREVPDSPVPFSEFKQSSLLADRFDWKAALSLALASQLSYQNSESVIDTAKEVWGFDSCDFFSKDDTECFVAKSPDVVLVSFRGTESVGDWLTDLNALSTDRFYGTVHRGFRTAFSVVDSDLREVLAAAPDRPIVLTGHSLGGALATIAAAEWAGQFPISRIYTYGQPAVGKRRFPAHMIAHYSGKMFRFVNDDDIITMVPPTYDHVGRLKQLDAFGNLIGTSRSATTESTASEKLVGQSTMSSKEFDHLRAQLLEARLRRQAPGMESTAAIDSPMLEGFFPSFSDHRIGNYITKIAASAGISNKWGLNLC